MGSNKSAIGFLVIVLVILSVGTANFSGLGSIFSGLSDSFAAQPNVEENAEESDSSIKISEDCLSCHEDYDQSLSGTAHKIQEHYGKVACSDCHKGAETHMEDPEISNISNPGKLGVNETSAICAACHMSSHEQTMNESNVHAVNDISCSECHTIHNNRNAALLQEEEVDLCLSCHEEVRGEFALPYRHPVSDGIMKCSECHMLIDENRMQFDFTGTNESCYRCHNWFQGPFPYEHQATVDYSTEEGGCLTCHAPHGSAVPRMLKQTYEHPNYALCSQCHVVPGHQYNSQHGSDWAGVSCSECHVDIHGSYVNEMFLSPTLQAEGCLNSVCHPY